jgi:hypothetical protein
MAVTRIDFGFDQNEREQDAHDERKGDIHDKHVVLRPRPRVKRVQYADLNAHK